MAVNILLSYALHPDRDLAAVRALMPCGRLMIDSGAFTAHTKGREIRIEEYAAFLERWRGCWDHAITLDVIGDPAATARNTEWLHRRGLPVMPVFTRGSRTSEFDAMVRDVGFVCVGALVGTPKTYQKARVGLLQRRAEERGGGIHALGVGSLDTLREARPYSSDASSISGAFRFGSVLYFTGTTVRATALADRKKLTRDREAIRAHGIDLADLVRTGRMPQRDARPRLIEAMGLAYATADEYLKRARPVPGPRGLPDGPHLYSSIGASVVDVVANAGLDRRIHTGDLDVPIWRRWGRTHTCPRTRKDAPDAS